MGSKCLTSQFACKYQHFKTRASKWIDKRNWNKMFPFLTIFLYIEHLFLHDPMMILPGTCTSMKFYLLCIYFSITWLHGEKGVLTNYKESWLWVWFFSTDNQIFGAASTVNRLLSLKQRPWSRLSHSINLESIRF